jgi:Mce-associated membrane protein
MPKPANAQPADDGQPAETQPAETQPTEAQREGAARINRERWRRAPLLLAVASVLLAGFAAWAGVQAHDLHDQRAGQNQALTDAATTGQVRRQLTGAINTIFSYNYAHVASTRRAAQQLLTGPAIRQYNQLFGLVQQEAPSQQLVLTTQVTSAGVELLIGNRARVLVFANQSDTRMTTHQTSEAGAMFAVNAVRLDGRWKIDSIDTFSGSS